MKLNANTVSYLTLLMVILSAFLLSGCGTEDETTVQRHVIPIELNIEEKVVYVDNFLNLTENDDLNLFEDGIAEMLEQSLSGLRNINLVPRTVIKSQVAVIESPAMELSPAKAATENGAQYMIDGWMERTEKNTYRVFANLHNLETSEIQRKFAIAEFDNRDQALPKLNEFVIDITSKLSQSNVEVKQVENYKYFDYEFYRARSIALASYNRGRPDIAISVVENVLDSSMEKLRGLTDEEEIEKLRERISISNYYLAQLYLGIGNIEKSEYHLNEVLPHKERYYPIARLLIEGMKEECTNNFDAAREKYSQLVQEMPHEKFFHIRLADTVLKQTNDQAAALKILEGALQYSSHASLLHKKVAELRIALEGEGALESLAESADEAGQSTVRTEVVSSVINNMIEQEMVGSLPSLKPVVMKTEECTETGEHIISLGDYKINTARLEEALDYSCPITTDSAVKVAYIAVKNGNSKLAHIIADNISKHGTAPNSGDAYHTISAMALMADNKMKKAWDHAVQIDKNNAARYLTLGNILMHEGKYKKAISVMEKALSVDQKPHPLIYYNIASAYLTTGNYKKWKYFNDQFLKASVDAKLIPENLIEKLKKIEIFQ